MNPSRITATGMTLLGSAACPVYSGASHHEAKVMAHSAIHPQVTDCPDAVSLPASDVTPSLHQSMTNEPF
jgi:hypothetical protein